MNMKGVGGQYDSFQNNEALVPYAQRALVRSTEASTEAQISAYPFQTELDIQGGNWHYLTGAGYTDAATLINTLMQNVSRNGSLLLNLTQHGRGNLDPQCTQIAQDIGAWLKVNGEAVYASRPFEVGGEGSGSTQTVAYTRNNGNVYATLFGWSGGAISLPALKSGGVDLGNRLQGRNARLQRGDDVLPERSRADRDAQRNRVSPDGHLEPAGGVEDARSSDHPQQGLDQR